MRWTLGLAMILLSASALGDTVVLRPFARVSPGAAVTLGDVAELSGPAAEAQAGLVVLGAEEAGAGGVDVARVRKLLREQARVNMGRLEISGSTCAVRVVCEEAAAVAASPRPVAAPAPVGETVKDRVAARIASALLAEPRDLRLDFRDQPELLAMAAAGRTVAVQPTGVGDVMNMSIRVYDGDTIAAQGVARVGVLVRRDVVIATTTLSRGMQTRDEMLQSERQWMAPSAQPATMAQASGAVVRTRVDAGKVVMARDVEPPIVVRKGDLVSVDCVAGTVVVGTTARAKENGADGQVIELQSLSSKKTYLARVNGAGRAVLVLPGEDAPAKP